MLDRYIELMKSVANLPDTEVAHQRADNLLCEALLHLAHKTEDYSKAQDLVLLFKEMDKWYS